MSYSSKVIDHLGLVAGMCDHLGISTLIDRLIPSDTSQQHISHGDCVKALILNGLGFVERRLYLVSDFFSDKPIEHLLGEGIEASHLNDDRLGRCLDALYEGGLSELFSQIASQACHRLGMENCPDYAHLDSTSFHVDGRYATDSEQEGVTLTQGYSRDHRPDLNQVMLNLVVENSAGIPLHMEALSGNSSDKVSFRQTISQHIEALSTQITPQCWVADSALYCQETLEEISAQHTWLTRVPETIQAAKEVLENVGHLPLYSFDTPALETYQYHCLGNTYGGIRQYWYLIFSQQAYQRESKTLQKKHARKGEEETKKFVQLCQQVFACKADAQKALDRFAHQLRYSQLIESDLDPIEKYEQKGRPKKNTPKVVKGYKIRGTLVGNRLHYQEEKKKKGFFILASNDIEEEFGEVTQKLRAYKQQDKVEKGFRFLKDKQFMASTIFVKNPQRVEAILMIMTLCLLVYAALEKELRQQLDKQKETLPNQAKKEIKNPTMRWVFTLLRGIHSLYVGEKQEMIILNITPVQEKVIRLLGKKVEKYYKLE